LKPVVFLHSARADLQAEFSYYTRIEPRLAARFVLSVESTTRLIAANPEAMRVLAAEVRRWPVRGFPHGVLYRVEPKRIVILAVFHPKQDPEKWKGRTGR
jgi:plasmid stabilization system protein ParE